MNFENMGNLNNSGIKGPEKSPKDDELIIEKTRNPFERNIPQTLEEEKRHKLEATASTGLFDLDDPKFKDKETFEERAKKAVQEAMPVANNIVDQRVEEIKDKDNSFLAHSNKINEKEKREGDMGHLLMLEEKIKKLETAIAKGEDFSRELIEAKKEYDVYFKEYSEMIKKESLNK